jgi:hypothetical protein
MTAVPPLTVFNSAWVMANEWLWAELTVVVFEIPAAGGVSTSALWIDTWWVWPLTLVEVNDWEVPPPPPPLGVVELPQAALPNNKKARQARPATAVKALFEDI